MYSAAIPLADVQFAALFNSKIPLPTVLRNLLPIVLLLVIAVCVVLYFVDPSTQVLMPKCPFRLLTGFDCPGCGFQRALHAALHGEWGKAVGYNLFLFLLIPYLLALIVSDLLLRGSRYQRPWQRITHHPRVLIGYVVVYLVWGVARNVLGV